MKGKTLLPKRLGLSMQPNFLSYVLVSPKSRIIRPKAKDFNTAMVIKSDEFYKQTQDNIDSGSVFSAMRSVANMISQESLRALSEKIAAYHQPVKVDYYNRFAIADLEQAEPRKPQITMKENVSKYYYYSCKQSISKKVATFCFSHKARFHRKAYCYGCQKTIPSGKSS